MCWSSFTLPSSSVDATNISPKVLGSTNRRSPPCWNVTITCVCGASAIRPFARVNRPLIPKCTTQTSPPSSESRTYLPRRSVFTTLWPAKPAAKSFRVLCRRITRIAFLDPLTSTSLIFFPTTSRSRSRRITSTSGSSIHAPPHRSSGAALRDACVGLARSLLLGLLLRAPDARPQRLPGYHDGRRELLLMVGAPVLDLVHGERTELLGGELLKDRLVVAVSFTADVRLHPRFEQALDQLARSIETQIEIDGTEDGFQRVGEDARLVPAARLFLALAQQDDGPQVELPCHVGERGHVHDRCAELCEITLRHPRVHPVREVGDDQTEHRVPEELEPFVRDRQIVFERERSMREGSLAELRVAEGDAERAVECLEPMADGRLAHAATRPRPLDGRRSTRNSHRRGVEASVACIAGMRCTPALRPSRWPGVSRSASCSASSSGRPWCGFLPCLASSVEVGEIGEQVGEHRELLIELLVPRTLPEVAVPAARRAEALAVGAAERGERHLDADHVTDHLVGVQLLFRTEWVRVGVLVGVAQEQLVEVQVERLVESHETPGAPEAPPAPDVARNEDALHDGLEQEIGPDRGIPRHPSPLRRETLDGPDDGFLPRRTRAPHQVTDIDSGKHQSLPTSSVSPCSSYSSVSSGRSSWGASA